MRRRTKHLLRNDSAEALGAEQEEKFHQKFIPCISMKVFGSSYHQSPFSLPLFFLYNYLNGQHSPE